MIQKRVSPRAPGSVEGSGIISVQQRTDLIPAPLQLQVATLSRRFGLTPALAATIAILAFPNFGARA